MAEPQTHDPGVLERLFGSTSATARVLDFLSTGSCWDYNKKDIAEGSNVTQQHITKTLEKLEKIALVKKTRNVGRSEMYQYNNQNQTAKLLDKFCNDLASFECEQIVAQEEAEEQTSQQQTETQPETETQDETELLTTPA